MISCFFVSVCGLASIYGYLYIQFCFKKCYAYIFVFVLSVLYAAFRIILIVFLYLTLLLFLYYILEFYIFNLLLMFDLSIEFSALIF